MRPTDRHYSESHEWVKLDGDVATVGITDHAVEQLGDLTFLEMRVENGQEVKTGEHFGEIESVKTVADLYIPLDGSIAEINQDLPDHLDHLADSPFEKGWMLKIKVSNAAAAKAMMDAAGYEKHIAD